TRDARAKPMITALTRASADRNIDQGDNSLGFTVRLHRKVRCNWTPPASCRHMGDVLTGTERRNGETWPQSSGTRPTSTEATSVRAPPMRTSGEATSPPVQPCGPALPSAQCYLRQGSDDIHDPEARVTDLRTPPGPNVATAFPGDRHFLPPL